RLQKQSFQQNGLWSATKRETIFSRAHGNSLRNQHRKTAPQTNQDGIAGESIRPRRRQQPDQRAGAHARYHPGWRPTRGGPSSLESGRQTHAPVSPAQAEVPGGLRSEERRVGKEWR